MTQEHKTAFLLTGIGILLVAIGIGIGFLGGALFNNWHFGQVSMSSSTPSVSTAASSSLVTTDQNAALVPGLSSATPPPGLANNGASANEPAEYAHVSGWQVDTEAVAGFTIMYPNTFTIDKGSQTPTNSWRLDSSDPGILVASISVPPAVDPGTSFSGGTITVGYSINAKALANCFVAQSGTISTSTASVNGTKFFVYSSSNGTTSYRTTNAGACYALDYTIHSSDARYDQAEVKDVLNRVIGTFTLL